MRFRRLIVFLAAASVAVCFGRLSHAQSVTQSGPSIGGHSPMYVLGPGGGFASVMDSGFASGLSAAGTQTGAGLGEFLQVNHAPGSGVFGTHFSLLDNPINAPGGYHGLSFDANALGGGLITYNAFGAASPLPLQICTNGTCVQFPFAVGGIVGPNPSVVGDIPTFGNTTGTLVSDSLLPAVSLGRFATQFHADVTGATDATVAVQACLDAAGLGNTCHINGTVKILGDLSIPAGTTMDCGVVSAIGLGVGEPLPILMTGPRLLLNPGHPLKFGGTSATLQNCVVVPNGMTFPQTGADVANWTGTAIDTNGQSSPQILNVAITGFDTCVNTTTNGASLRPFLRQIWYDCRGITNGASFITGSNGDTAILEDVTGQPLATAANTCDRIRPGSGMIISGSTRGRNLLVQDYLGTQVFMVNTGGIDFDQLWADFAAVLGCPQGASEGLSIAATGDVHIGHLDINSTFTGLVIRTQSPTQVVHINNLFINNIGHHGVVLGLASGTTPTLAGGGNVQIDMLNTNDPPIMVGGMAIVMEDTFASLKGLGMTGNTSLTINGGMLQGVNGGAPPYILMQRTQDASLIHIAPNIRTDLAVPNSLYNPPLVACSGVGSGGCSILPSQLTSPWNVVVSITAGAGAAASGTAVVEFPISSPASSCVASYQNGWTAPGTISAYPIDIEHVQVNWSQAAPLTPSNVYNLSLNCVVN